jgi:hypothetical protein
MRRIVLLMLAAIALSACVVEPGGYYPRVRPLYCGYGGCR